jgi:hypothetical protein
MPSSGFQIGIETEVLLSLRVSGIAESALWLISYITVVRVFL